MPRKAADSRTLPEILASIPPLEELRITFTTCLQPAGRPGIRLSTKSVVDYKRRAKSLCPIMIAEPGQTHADLLSWVVVGLRLSYELSKGSERND